MKIFKLKKRFIKKFLRACITLFMSISIVCCSVVAPAVSMPVRSEASAVAFGKIATYILSAIGAVNIGTGGRVSKVSGSKFDGLVEMVSDAFGTGVYQDASGNYVFSNEFSKNVLSYLDGQSDINYRVISDFTAPSDWNGIWENIGYVPPSITQHFTAFKNEFDKYMIGAVYSPDESYNGYSTPRYYKSSGLMVFDMSEVAFLCKNPSQYNYQIVFYDKNLNQIYPDFYMIGGTFYENSFHVGDIYNKSNYPYTYYGYLGSGSGNMAYFNGGVNCRTNYSYPSIFDHNERFLSFPYCHYMSSSKNYWFEFYSNRSVILCDNITTGNEYLNKNSGVFINNYYNTIPSVTNNTLEQNDWDVVYNNYITNVSNSYNIENGTDQPFDQEKLRKWMSKYSEQIIDAINNGSTDISEQLNYTNEWLNKIYTKLSIIEDLLVNSNSGSSAVVSGGSSSWSDNDVNTLLGDVNNIRALLSDNNTYLLSLQSRIDTTNETLSGASAILSSINSNTYNTVTQLQSLYTLLSNVYNAILNISSGGGGSGGGNVVPVPDSDPYEDWFDVLHNIDELDLDNVISKWDVVKSLIQDSLPFVMLTLISVTLTNFVAQPQDPIFTIPVKLQNNFVDIDETITIDLTLFESILPMVRSMILIFWAVCLILFWLWLLPKLIYIY